MTHCDEAKAASVACQPAPASPRMPVAAMHGAPPLASAPEAPVRDGVPMRHPCWAPITVRGTGTGRFYRFAAGGTVQLVDADDIAGLREAGFSTITSTRRSS